jgi:uncharacterized protein (DUF433 family)
MIPSLQADPLPLRLEESGAIRVGNSRILLDQVVREFLVGADPESIVNAYPTLQLADVYAVIAYYLRHQAEVDNYLQQGQAEAAELRREIESSQPGQAELRAKLRARRGIPEANHASAGG